MSILQNLLFRFDLAETIFKKSPVYFYSFPIFYLHINLWSDGNEMTSNYVQISRLFIQMNWLLTAVGQSCTACRSDQSREGTQEECC